MEKEIKYMYICRKCGSTFSSKEEFGKLKCQDCNSKLERIPFTNIEWNRTDASGKDEFKSDFLSKNDKMPIKFTNKEATPLKWHSFNKYFRIPMTILLMFSEYIQYGRLYALIMLIACVLIFFGIFSWKRYVLYLLLGIDMIQIAVICLNGFSVDPSRYASGTGILAIVFIVLEILYYLRREKLFDNGKVVDKTEGINNTTVTQDSTKLDVEDKKEINKVKYIDETVLTNNVKYCRMCGSKLKEESRFCHNCGKEL